MPIASRKVLKDIIVEAIEEVAPDTLADEEVLEIASVIEGKLKDEDPNLFDEDLDDSDGVGDDESDA